MNLTELKHLIDKAVEIAAVQRLDPADITVGIAISRIGQLGASAITPVKAVSLGFDWNKNKLLIHPDLDTETRLVEVSEKEYKKQVKAFNNEGRKIFTARDQIEGEM